MTSLVQPASGTVLTMAFTAELQMKWSSVANILRVDNAKEAQIHLQNISKAVKQGDFTAKGQHVSEAEFIQFLHWIRPQLSIPVRPTTTMYVTKHDILSMESPAEHSHGAGWFSPSHGLTVLMKVGRSTMSSLYHWQSWQRGSGSRVQSACFQLQRSGGYFHAKKMLVASLPRISERSPDGKHGSTCWA